MDPEAIAEGELLKRAHAGRQPVGESEEGLRGGVPGEQNIEAGGDGRGGRRDGRRARPTGQVPAELEALTPRRRNGWIEIKDLDRDFLIGDLEGFVDLDAEGDTAVRIVFDHEHLGGEIDRAFDAIEKVLHREAEDGRRVDRAAVLVEKLVEQAFDDHCCDRFDREAEAEDLVGEAVRFDTLSLPQRAGGGEFEPCFGAGRQVEIKDLDCDFLIDDLEGLVDLDVERDAEVRVVGDEEAVRGQNKGGVNAVE